MTFKMYIKTYVRVDSQSVIICLKLNLNLKYKTVSFTVLAFSGYFITFLNISVHFFT